jgi:hypothetical protein
MRKNNTHYSKTGSHPPSDQAMGPDFCIPADSVEVQGGDKDSDAIGRIIAKLTDALGSDLQIRERVLLLIDLQPEVSKSIAPLPKPVASFGQSNIEGAQSQALAQHIKCLMAKNLKRALEDMPRPDLAYSEAFTGVRLWLVRRLFGSLGELIEYSVRWGTPYPLGVWSTLHELYFDFVGREGQAARINGDYSKVGFDPSNEYKGLLLLGLAYQLFPTTACSPWFFDQLASLAEDSRLKRADGYCGAFDLFVVDIAQDKPPRLSGVIESWFHGWVLEPAREFFKLGQKDLRGHV